MKIVAVSSVLNEAAILPYTISHLIGEGVQQLLISDGGSTDGTRQLLTGIPEVVWQPQEGPFDQAEEINKLCRQAREYLDADWIIPFDADEFWCGKDGQTILQILDSLDEHTSSISSEVWGHQTWELRYEHPHHLPKICFKAHPDNRVNWGNHDGNGGPGRREFSLLQIRELQYRDWDHFQHKIRKAADLYASYNFPVEYGAHLRKLVDMTDTKRWEAWQAILDEPVVNDPIPYRGALPR